MGGGRASRDPIDYYLTDHYEDDSLTSPLRFLTRERVEQAIIRGVDYPGQGGRGKFRRKHEVDGVTTVVVIPKGEDVVVTAWLEVTDWAMALRSDDWTTEQLQKIRAFNDEEHKKAWWSDG